MAERTDQKVIISLIKKYLELLHQQNISFDKAYLFGSYATGNAEEESDIDLAIIAEDWKPDIFDAQFELMKIAKKVDTRIEPHLFRKEDFENGNPFIQEIMKVAKAISDS